MLKLRAGASRGNLRSPTLNKRRLSEIPSSPVNGRDGRNAEGIAQAHGVDLSGFDPGDFRRDPPDHLPSIRQDYECGRPLELDSLLLVPLAFARAAELIRPSSNTIAALAARMDRDQKLRLGR